MGLREIWGAHGRVSCTIFELWSWARDPGGMSFHREDVSRWRTRRGPLNPYSDAAMVLYDWERALSTLGLVEQVIVVLNAAGFSQSDIGAVMGIKQQRVSAILEGRILRDKDGKKIIDPETGEVQRRGGAVGKIVSAMNGSAA